MAEDKTGIAEMLWLLRLRQVPLPLDELTCKGRGAPWECSAHGGQVPDSPEGCESFRAGTCTPGVVAGNPESYPRTCNTGVTRPVLAPDSGVGSGKSRG